MLYFFPPKPALRVQKPKTCWNVTIVSATAVCAHQGRVHQPTWPLLENKTNTKREYCSPGPPSRVTGDFPNKRHTGEEKGGEGRKNKKDRLRISF